MLKVRTLIIAIVAGAFAAAALMSCGDNPLPPDTACSRCSADELVQAANDSLGAVFPGASSTREWDRRYEAAREMYGRALTKEPGSAAAHFGFALATLLIMNTEPGVASAGRQWSAYVERRVPGYFRIDSDRPLNVPAGLYPGGSGLEMPFVLMVASGVAPLLKPMDISSHTGMAQCQEVIRGDILAAATLAASHLATIAGDPRFRFILTPAMQGDPAATPLEVDQTDVLMMLSGCELLSGVARVATAWNLGFASFDSVALAAAVQPGSDWLQLRPDGDSDLQQARAEVLKSIDTFERALNAFVEEEAEQGDDLMPANPELRARAASVALLLPAIRTAITGTFPLNASWAGDPSNYQTIDINMAALFDNPAPDLKALLPGWTALVRRYGLDQHTVSNDGTSGAVIAVPAPGAYFGIFSFIHDGTRGYERQDFTGDEALRSELARFVERRFDVIRQDPTWSGYYSGSASVNGYLSGVWYDVPYHEQYGIAESFAPVPVITWDANTLSEWNLPDPSLHGMLPDIDTSAELWEILGYDTQHWDKYLIVDWTEFTPGFASTN